MAKVEVSHIRAAKERLEQIWPGNCRPALALEVAQIMADAEQRGREAGKVEVHALLCLLADAADPDRSEFRITREAAEDKHPFAMLLVQRFANKLRGDGRGEGG